MKKVALSLAFLLISSPIYAQLLRGPLNITAHPGEVSAGVFNIPTWTASLTGTWVGSIAFQCTPLDGTIAYSNKIGTNEATGVGAAVLTSTGTNVNGTYAFPNNGCARFKVATTAWTSGTLIVVITRGSATSVGGGAAGGGGGDASAANQGTMIGHLDTIDNPVATIGTTPLQRVAIFDAANAQITTFGGGTEYTTGSAQASPIGRVALGWDGTAVRALSTNSAGSQVVHFSSAQAVTGPVTDAQLRATPVPVSGTVASNSTQTGTWTVQPGNTANTTPWLVAANIIAGETGIDADAGTSTSKTPRVVNSDDSPDVVTLGSTSDAAVAAGAAGSVSAKLRLLTDLINQVNTKLDTLDNAINGTGFNISKVAGADPITSRCLDDAKVQQVAIAATASGNLQLVGLTASQIIYVCGYEFTTDAAVNVKFTRGTGTNCGTGTADVSGLIRLIAAGDGMVVPNTGALQLKGTVSEAFCINLSGTANLGGTLKYVKE